MRILFLSHYFPPEVNAPASRTSEHCRAWVKAGHEVTVVTCAPNHPRGEVYPGYSNRLCQVETVDGINVVRLWTFLSANEGFALRTLNYVSFMIACILAAPFLPKSDVVLSTSPQFFNGLAGYFVSRMKRAPWVLEIRDLWPESILAVGAIRNRAIIAALRKLERFAYNSADRIVVVTDAFAEYMAKMDVRKEKISVIKNGVDVALFDPATEAGSLRDDHGIGSRTVAAYFGTHGMAHHLDTVFDAAARLEHRADILFLLVGDGAEKQRLTERLNSQGLPNVIMLPQQSKEKMPEFWAMADISLVLLRKTDLFKSVIPSKIFEAMGMKTPIILGVEGESAEIIKRAQAGVTIEPENHDELAAAVLELSDDKEQRARFGEEGRRFVERYFDRQHLAHRYLDILETLVTPPAG